MLNALKQLLIAFMIGLILCPPSLAYAEGIHVDPNAAAQHQATMDAAQNGVPVVNIAAPNGSGLSHNQFTDFNVGTQGVVINNSTAIGVSQLGGMLASNPNFNGRAASTILNEVTGTGRSNLQGFTEIFGRAANYILANPNGISINGGGFINTPKASLVTGTPEFSGNNLLGLNVSGGDILVEGAGINANNIDAFELVTRVATINAEIYAKKLNIVTGRNRYNPATETATPLPPDGSPAPTVSIDSSALGGMYAGRIKLVGTEAGVGVNTQGVVQATQHLEMTADGKIQIKDSASSAGTLALTSNSDTVEVSGTVKAAGTATITGQTVTVAKVDPVDAAVISADKVVVNAGTLNNQHLIAADRNLAVSATFLNNIGTLYSGGTGLFRISDTLHNDQGSILSQGNMVFEGSAAGQRMEILQNDSGSIESLAGGLTFRAKTFNNNNSLFSLVEGDQVLSYEEAGYWTGRDRNRGRTDTIFKLYTGRAPLRSPPRTIALIYPNQLQAVGLDSSRHVHSRQEMIDALAAVDTALAADPDALTDHETQVVNQVRSLVNSGKRYFGTIVTFTSGYFVAASVTQDTATGQDQGAAIAAQGNIFVEAGAATNNVSTITSATGDIRIDADTFTNVGQEIYKRTTYEWGRGVYHSHSSPHIVPTGGGKETALTPIDYAYGLLDAGGKVNISSGVVANGVVEHNGVLNPPDPATQAQKVDDVAAITTTIPSNGLFQPNTDPAQNYQIETNPNLTDLNKFFGSDYALAHMGFDPNAIANKRLCDGYCETTTVRKQIQELTGRRFLEDGVATDTEQFVKLMDNAVQAQTDLHLSVGVALSKEQVAALTQDIVWLERQTVNGEEVLVPVVYLCSNSLKDIIQNGSSIVGREVEINADTVVNAGLIKSDDQFTATAESFLNMGGTVAGQDISITATDSIYNTGGTVSGDSVALTAANDVVSTSETVGFSGLGTSYDQVSKRANISSTGSLAIQAGGNVTVMGTDLTSGGDTTLSAGDSVVISSQELKYANKLSGSGFNTHTNLTHNRSSTVNTGGNLKIEAGKDVAVHGSQLESNGDTNIKAGGNLSVTAATDSTDFYSHISGGGGGFFGGKKSQTAVLQQRTNVASSIKSGGSVTMESGTSDATGSLSVVGSKLEAEDNITLKSANEILVASGEEEHYQRNDEKKSGLFSSKSSKSASGSVTQVASEVKSGGSVDVQANSDVMVSASNIHGDQGVSIKSDTGDVRIAGGQNKSSSTHEEKKSGIGLFVSKGRLDVARFKENASKSTESGNVASQVTSGTDVIVDAANDATVIGSTVAAENDVNITAGRDANIIPGRNARSSQQSSKKGGIGIGLSLSENEISISAGYKGVETKTNSSGEYNAGSLVSAGNDVNIEAGRNINQVSSEVAAGQDVKMKAGEDLNVTAAQDVEHLDEYVKKVEVGFKLAAKQSVTTAIRTLAQTPKNITSGEGGAGAVAVTAGSSTLQGVSAAQQVVNPSASVSLTAGLSMSESKSSSDTATSVSSKTTAGRDATFDAGQDLTIEGGRVRAGEDATLTAGQDITITSGKNSHETSSSSNSISANAGIGATVSTTNGTAAGVQVSGAASGADSDYRSDSNTNAQVAAGQDLTVKSGQDTTVAGANLEGNKVNMDVGGNLVVASKQDTSDSKSSNWSAGGSATVGMGASVGIDADSATGDSASIGFGKGSGSSAWVNNQTSIIGKEQVDIRVEKNTHVEGSVIAAENGNLKLDTDTLTYKDIHDHDKASNYQASVSVSKSAENAKNSENRQDSENKQSSSSVPSEDGAKKDDNKKSDQQGNPYAGTLEGSSSSHDRRQINRATIGEGEIIIRSDPDAGLEGLNRDLAKAQEITKDKKTSVTVYIDSAAIDEVMSGGAGIKKNFKNLAQAVKDLLPEDAVREREAITAQQDVYEELLANGMKPEDAAKVLEENPLAVTCLTELAPYITDDGELNISEEEASKILDGLTDSGVVSFDVADNSAKITYLGDEARAKLQFWAAVGAVKAAGASAVAALQFANDLAGETLYYASGGSLYQAEHESFHQTVNDVAEAVESLVTNPMDVGSAVVQDYVSRYEQYEDLAAQGKYKEAGEVLGSLTYEVAETLIATGAAGKAVLEKTTKLAGMLKGVKAGAEAASVVAAKVDSSLLTELLQKGVKVTPEDVLFAQRMPDGKIAFLEKGNSAKGLTHIIERHASQFAAKGVSKDEIINLLTETVATKAPFTVTKSGLSIYRVNYGGKDFDLGVVIGNNGFVVTSYPWSK